MNILNLIQSQLSPQAIGQVSNAIGESPDSTKTAIGTAVPALLGSLLGKVNATPDGAKQVYNAVQQSQPQGGWTDSIGSLLSGITGGQQSSASSGILNSLLGSKLSAVTDFIAGHSGIKGSSAMSILGMAAPLLMSTIGKLTASQGLGASGLGQLLNSQSEHLKDAIPSGLANTLGIGSLLSGAPETTKVPTDTATYQQRQTAYARPVTATATPVAPSHSSPLKWAVPLLLAVGLGAWALMHRSNNNPPASGGTSDYVQTQTGHAVNKTPDLSNLNLTPGSVADRVAKAISSGDLTQKIDLQGLSMDNNGHLAESANGEVQQLGSVLKAVPNLRLAITGYGSTDEDGLNKADNSLKSALESAGITADRVIARGATGSGVSTLQLMK